MRKGLTLLFLLVAFLTRGQEPDISGLVSEINSHKIRDRKWKRCNRISDSLLQKQQYSVDYKFLHTLRKQYDKLENDSFRPDIHNILGDFYMASISYSQALDEFLLADKIYEKQNRPKGRCGALTSMGNCYYYINNLERALECYKLALAINEQYLRDEETSSNIYNNIGIIYSIRKNFVMGMNFFKKALKVYQDKKDSLSMGQSYNNFAAVFLEQGNTDSAYYYCRMAMGLKERFGAKSDIIDSYNNMGNICTARNEVNKAIDHLMKALRMQDTSKYTPHLEATYKYLQDAHEKKKNITLAYRYFKLTRAVRDTIDAHNKAGNLQQKEVIIGVSKAHIADSLATAEEKRLHVIELTQKKKENIFLVIALAAAGLIVLVLYNRFRVTHKQKVIINAQKHLVEAKQKEILDSIHYAKRIQQSLLTSERYIQKEMRRLAKDGKRL